MDIEPPNFGRVDGACSVEMFMWRLPELIVVLALAPCVTHVHTTSANRATHAGSTINSVYRKRRSDGRHDCVRDDRDPPPRAAATELTPPRGAFDSAATAERDTSVPYLLDVDL